MLACNASTIPGITVLVNGQKPDAGAQTPKFVVPSGKKIRLRLLNEGISRHFRLKLLNSGDNKLYRIGGQGGLLDNVVLEGGTKGTWVTHYRPGRDRARLGERADVIIVPSGSQGAIIQLVGNPLPDPFRSAPACRLIIRSPSSRSAERRPTRRPRRVIRSSPAPPKTSRTSRPARLSLRWSDPAPFGGSSDETIRLTTRDGRFAHQLPFGLTVSPPRSTPISATATSSCCRALRSLAMRTSEICSS